MKLVLFLSFLFTGLVLGPAAAHVLELPHKIGLDAQEYLTVQQIYGGWSLLGIAVFGALISDLVLTILTRGQGTTFRLALLALLCIAMAQVLFWAFTYPANLATQNWTMLPANWEHLRYRWEYSHAAGAVLDLGSFLALVLLAIGRMK